MQSFILLLIVVAVQGTAPLLYADQSNANTGTYIVVLKDGLSLTQRDAHMNALQRTISGSNESEILSLFSIGNLVGYTATLSTEHLEYERNNPNVKYIEVDQEISINYQQEVSPFDSEVQTGATWGLDRIDQRALPLDGLYHYNSIAGSGVAVYVIDTGIRITHQEFEGRASLVFNSITNELPGDLNGHGTHCAGTIAGATYGVAKKANVYSVKVLDALGLGTTAGVVSGIDYVTNNRDKSRPSVAILPLGGGVSNALDTSVQNSIASGVVYSIAAGNSAADACNASPARVSTAITVGATDPSDNRVLYSNFGRCVDLFAPGSGITSAWIGSDTATNTISGTSSAAAHVAGAVAVHQSISVSETPAATKAWAASVATPGVVLNAGPASPNLLLYSPYE